MVRWWFARRWPCVGDAIDLILLHVVDDRPRRDVEAFRGPLRRMAPERRREIDAAEESAGRAALAEAEAAARDAGAQVTSITTRLERGKPEQVIVALAREAYANMIALRPRERPMGFHWSARHLSATQRDLSSITRRARSCYYAPCNSKTGIRGGSIASSWQRRIARGILDSGMYLASWCATCALLRETL